MIAGIGTDIVDIARMQDSIDRLQERLIDRLFTKEEQKYCQEKRNPTPHWAGRFAIKEAFFKALGTGLREGMSWHDVSVTHNDLGAPLLLLSKPMQDMLNQKNIVSHHISISHSDASAIGMVVLERA